MAQNSAPKKENIDKRQLVHNLSTAINPLLKSLQNDSSSLQLPELALRCAQFFHSISQYCLQYYRNDVRQKDLLKTKNIKKQQKQHKQKAQRGRNKKKEEQKEDATFFEKPEPPRKPLTAYIIYFQDKKQHFVERYPTLNLSELTKLIAKEWKELSDKERQVFLDRASDDRKRYEQQMIEFKRLYGKMDRFMNDEALESAPEVAAIQAIIHADPEVESIIKETQKGGEMEEEQRESAEDADQGEGEENEDVQQVDGEGEEGERSSEGENNQSENNEESSESAPAISNEKDE